MKSSLQDVLTLESLGDDVFRASHHKENFHKALFGGQVLAQSLMAAGLTVDGILPHSLHAYFLRPGSSQSPVDYTVVRNRDGKSFSHRTVNAVQAGKLIFTAMVSFHGDEHGFEHADTWRTEPAKPELTGVKPSPELAPNQPEMEADAFAFYPLTTGMLSTKREDEPATLFWMRCIEPLLPSPLVQACALAYASDFGLLATTLTPHPASLFKGQVMGASVDHAMWFHEHSFSLNDWLFYEIDSPWAGHARGFARGKIFNQKGRLLASSSQEGLIRPKKASE